MIRSSRARVADVSVLVVLLVGLGVFGGIAARNQVSGAEPVPQGERRQQTSSTGAYLGVDLSDIGSAVAKELRVTSRTGAVVAGVQPGSPAAEVGLERGDVILELGGEPTPKAAALEAALRQCTPGNRYVVELVRGQAYMSMLVTLKAVPEKPATKDGDPRTPTSLEKTGTSPGRTTAAIGSPIVWMTTFDAVLPAIGMRVTSAGTDEAHDLGIETPIGAVITAVQPDSPGAEAGLQRGDLITHAADREILCYEDFESLLFGAKPGARFPLRVVRGEKPFPAEIVLGQRDGQIQLYTHPTGAYQLRLPVSWSDGPREQSATPSVDRFQSWEKHYVLDCLPDTRPAPQAEDALDAFVGRALRQGWSNAHHVRLGGDPAAFVSREDAGEPRRLVYRIGLVRGDILCEFQLSAPIVSDTEALPVIVLQLLAAP